MEYLTNSVGRLTVDPPSQTGQDRPEAETSGTPTSEYHPIPIISKAATYGNHLIPATLDPDENICSICLEEWIMATDDIVRTRECGHVCQRDCLVDWFDSDRPNHNTCPECRRPLFLNTSPIEPYDDRFKAAMDLVIELFDDTDNWKD
jgi:hypothetical protein